MTTITKTKRSLAVAMLITLMGALPVVGETEEGSDKDYKHIITCEGGTTPDGKTGDIKVGCDRLEACTDFCEKTLGGSVPRIAGRFDHDLVYWPAELESLPLLSHLPTAELSFRQGRPSHAGRCSWTEWLDRDDPSGTGDFETLSDFVKAGKACEQPKRIQCRTVDGRAAVSTGQPYTCEPTVGGVCDNRKLPAGERCLDYRVRFCC